MKKYNYHRCVLPPKPGYCLPKLPPNSSLFAKFLRHLRTSSVLYPRHPECKNYFRNSSSMQAEQKRHTTGPYSLIIHPFSKLSIIIDILFFFAWSYSIIVTPIDDEASWTTAFENYCVFPFQYALILSFFFLGYVDSKTQEVILSHKMIALHYLRTYFFVDILAVTMELIRHFPAIFSVFETGYYYIAYKVLCIICYFFRKKFVITRFESILKLVRANKLVMVSLIHLLDALIYLHFSCCVVVFGVAMKLNGREADPPPQSWLNQAGFKLDASLLDPEVYSETLMLTMSYFVGAKRASYNITITHEQVCLTLVSLFGRLYTLFMIANVLQAFGLTGVSESQYENHIRQLENYMLSKDIPSDLRKRLLRYYEYKLQRRYFNEADIMGRLTEHLTTEIFLYKARKIVEKVTGLKQLPTNVLVKFIDSMKLITYSSKDIICEIDAQSDGVYFVANGTVAVFNREYIELAHLDDGCVFGITSIAANMHKHTYVAIETTEVYYLTKQQFFLLLSDYPDVIKTLEKTVLERLNTYNRVEEAMKRGGTDVLSRLRKQTLLETLTRRMNH